jgi:hypothetical protein
MNTPYALLAGGHRARAFRRRPILGRLIAGAACALAAGCGGGADAGSDGARGGAGADSPAGSGTEALAPSGAPRDACELIPVERIAAIVGGPVVTASDPGPQESSCAYTDESGQLPYVELTVYWTGGRQMLEIVHMGTAMAARMMAEPGDEALVDSIVRPGPVTGLGDTALFSDIMPSYVLTGDVLLEMGMPLLPDAREHFRPLAATALARL